MDEIADILEKPMDGVGEIPGHLLHPGIVGIVDNTGDVDASSLELHDDEHGVAHEPAKGEDLDIEEVHGSQDTKMILEKGLPSRATPPLRSRLEASIQQDASNATARDLMPDVGERPADTRVAPRGIVVGDGDDELSQLLASHRPSRTSRLRGRILADNELAVPPKEGVWRDNGSDMSKSGASEGLGADSEATALFVVERRALRTQQLTEDLVFSEEIVDGLLLAGLKPACDATESEAMEDGGHYQHVAVSRKAEKQSGCSVLEVWCAQRKASTTSWTASEVFRTTSSASILRTR